MCFLSEFSSFHPVSKSVQNVAFEVASDSTKSGSARLKFLWSFEISEEKKCFGYVI